MFFNFSIVVLRTKSNRCLQKTMAIFLNFVVKTAKIWLVLGGFFCVFNQSETICNLHSCYKFCARVTSFHSCYRRTALLSQPIRMRNFFVYIVSRKICLFCCKIHFSHSLAMLISRETSPKKMTWWKMRFFRYSPAVTKGLKKVTNLLQIGPFQIVKFANFSTKQVCNVKKGHFQCLVNVNGNFLI